MHRGLVCEPCALLETTEDAISASALLSQRLRQGTPTDPDSSFEAPIVPRRFAVSLRVRLGELLPRRPRYEVCRRPWRACQSCRWRPGGARRSRCV